MGGLPTGPWRLAAAVVFAMLASQARAVDVDELARDLLRLHSTQESHDFAYWLPAGSMSALNRSVTAAQQERAERTLKGYELFLFARQHVDAAGRATPFEFERPEDHVRLRLADGKTLAAVPEADLPPKLVAIAAVCKSMFEKHGDIGRALHVAVFKIADPADEPRIDAAKPGVVTLLLDDIPLVWHLPLAGAGPSAVDAASGEKFPGNYAFNPYTGAPLKHE